MLIVGLYRLCKWIASANSVFAIRHLPPCTQFIWSL